MIQDKLRSISNVTADDMLRALGLQKRRTLLDQLIPAIGYVAVGVIVGTSVGLLVAPKSGRETRRDISAKANKLKNELGAKAEQAYEEVRSHLPGFDSEAHKLSGRTPDHNGKVGHRHSNESV